MKLSSHMLKYLELNGVEYAFGITAGTCGSLWDSINDTSIKPIITKNEAGAVYSATNYADISNKLGLAMLAGGVGINNAINGIADASRRKLPIIIISGYVNRWQIGRGAIQELDTTDIVKPITKYSNKVLREEDVMSELKRAMEIALTPPYGPVHLAIPMDLQLVDMDICMPNVIDRNMLNKNPSFLNNKDTIDNIVDTINNIDKGIIFIGRGCKNISKELRELSEKTGWKIITTAEGKGIISTDFKNNLGAYGFSGTDLATKYVEESGAGCILILGTSLGESATRNYNEILIQNRKVIHIDWDCNELNKVFKANIELEANLDVCIPEILQLCSKKDNKENIKGEFNEPYKCEHSGLSTRLVLENIENIMSDKYHVQSDIGEYMNFVFKYLPIHENTGFGISLNYGAMGTAIGGSIGLALANKGIKTVIVAGDGSFFMNGTEILTAKEYNLDIVYLIINNAMLGYVEHGQNYIYKRKTDHLTQQRVSIRDIVLAMGIQAVSVKTIDELLNTKDLINKTRGPLVIELITDGSESPAVADRFKALNNAK